MKSKVIALYLPQFHETPENNEWWGKGYTDWTAVKGCKPNYITIFQMENYKCRNRQKSFYIIRILK